MAFHRPPERPNPAAAWPVAPANAQHMGQRDSQQDAFGFSNFSNAVFARHGGYLAVLADGMGGLANGVWASSQSVRLFIEAYQAKAEAETPADALRRAMHVANTVVHEEALRLKLVDRMGTTLVAAVVRDGELHWISAGDSRVYLFEAGQLRCLSVDHSYGEVLRQQVARGEISLSEAQAHPMRNALTSYLGRPEPIPVDASKTPLRISRGAWVLLCSDGLSGVLSEADIATQLHGEPQQACDRLLQAAIGRGLKNQDNTTVVVLHVPASGVISHAYSNTQARYEAEPTLFRGRRWMGAWGMAAAVLVTTTVSLGAWLAVHKLSATRMDSADASGVPIVVLPESPSTAINAPLNLGFGSSTLILNSPPAEARHRPNRDDGKRPERSARSPAAAASPAAGRASAGQRVTAGSTAGLAPEAAAVVAQRAAEQASAEAVAKAAAMAASSASAASVSGVPKLAASAASTP